MTTSPNGEGSFAIDGSPGTGRWRPRLTARSEILAFAGLAALAAVAILALGRDATFFHDEWWYLCGRALGDMESWFLPHNEHWVTVHVLVYRALVETFGTASYLPFHGALVLTHLAAAGGLFALVRREVDPGAGLAAAAILLFFGAGYVNLFWAFQTGFVGAVALGLWAMVALPARPRLAALLLVAAVATQGVGLYFVVAAAAATLWRRDLPSMPWLAAPVAAYAAWAFLERDAIEVRGGGGDPVDTLRFAVVGGLTAAGMGLGRLPGALAIVAVVLMRPSLTPLLVAGALGLASEFVSLALVRTGFARPESSHYLYVAAPFVLMIGASVTRSARVLGLGIGALVFTVNVGLLVNHGLAWKAETDASRAQGADEVPAGVCR